MTISVQCPGCRKQLKAKDELAGKRVKCPACGASVTIASAELRRDAPPDSAAPQPTSATAAAVSPPLAEQQLVPESRPGAAEQQAAKTTPRPRPRLDGLSPDYRIRLSQWVALARLHYFAILGPSIGYFLLFLLILGSYFSLSVGTLVVLPETVTSVLAFAAVPLIWLTFILFLFPSLAIGFHVVGQAQLQGKPWTFATFFSGLRWIRPLAGRAALLLLVEVVTSLPALVVPAFTGLIWREPPLVVLGFTAALVLGCSLAGGYVLLRLLYFSHLLIIDRGCGAIEALRGSWLLSRGHFWGLLGTMLLVLGAVGLIPLLVLGLHLLLPLPAVALFPLLALGIVAQLFAFPAGILLLNAGYLLVAGAEPLHGHPRAAPSAAPQRPSVWTWAPVGAVGAAVVLFGLGMSLLAGVERSRVAKLRERQREEAVRHAERSRLAEAQARAEAERQAQDLVAFLRAGGCWSMELYDWGESPLEAAAVGGPSLGPGGGGLGSPGLGGDSAGAGAVSRRQRILVLGPPDLLKTKRAVRLGLPIAPESGSTASLQQLEELSFSRSGLLGQRFFPQFADALAKGKVAAVLVHAVLQPMPEASSSAGGLSASAAGGPPGGAAGGFSSMGGAGGAGMSATGSHGALIPLDAAAPLTRERFLELVGVQSGSP